MAEASQLAMHASVRSRACVCVCVCVCVCSAVCLKLRARWSCASFGCFPVLSSPDGTLYQDPVLALLSIKSEEQGSWPLSIAMFDSWEATGPRSPCQMYSKDPHVHASPQLTCQGHFHLSVPRQVGPAAA